MQIIRDWFDVMNAKSKYQDQKSRNDKRKEIQKESERSGLKFLLNFHVWLKKWERNHKGLSAQTFYAAKVTSRTMISLVNYLLDQKEIEYVFFWV